MLEQITAERGSGSREGSGTLDGPAELARLRGLKLWDMLADNAARDPDRLALVGADDAGTVSRIGYSALADRVRSLSAGLAHTGVRRGDRVALWMTNSIDWVVCAFATMRLGAALVPLNTFLRPPEIHYMLSQSGARHLIMLDAFRAIDFPKMLGEIAPGIGVEQEPGFLYSKALPDLRNVVLYSRNGGSLAGAYDLETIEREASPESYVLADRLAAAVSGSDLAMVKYTSGSTGFPKGVMLSHGGIIANATLHARHMAAGPADVYFSMMPFFHAGGSIFGIMTMFTHGGTLVFTEAFDAKRAADLMHAEKATVTMTLLGEEIVEAALEKGLVLEHMRVGALPDEKWRKVYPNITTCITSYGLTETHGCACFFGYPSDTPPAGTGGQPLAGNEVRVVDLETGKDVPPGTPGEALIRGNLMMGYWNKPEETAKAFTEDGWFRSEDIVTMSEDGHISWVGRRKLMLKVGGENVSIEEIERVVTAHDEVLACAAAGVPDKRKMEMVRIYVVRAQDSELTEEALRTWLKPRLAHFKMPRDILFVQSLPRLGNGKLDRFALKKMVDEDLAAEMRD